MVFLASSKPDWMIVRGRSGRCLMRAGAKDAGCLSAILIVLRLAHGDLMR